MVGNTYSKLKKMNNELNVGNRVRVVSLPSFLKTAEPMPMLRSPDLIAIGEEGIIIDRLPAGYWSVKFNRGAFLIESKHIEKTDK